MWNIWVDTGGTFTDCMGIDDQKKVHRLKILSSSVLRGQVIEQLESKKLRIKASWEISSVFLDYELRLLDNPEVYRITDILDDVITLDKVVISKRTATFEITANEPVPILAARILTKTPIHLRLPKIAMRLGTTKGTNALLEKKGAEVVFITTKGFKDLLKIGNQQRPDIFSLNINKPKPLYKSVIEIDERIDSEGNVIKSIESEQLRIDLKKVIEKGYSPAVTFLNSYQNDVHEKKLSELLSKLGARHSSISTEISNVIKIVPRATTTVVNAYLAPVMTKYLGGIEKLLPENSLKIMSSSGAIINSNEFYPKDCLLSGPAGGIIGAANIAQQCGVAKLVSFDMGGTSTDVSIYDGKISYTYETVVADATIQSPAIDIETIAAGGGSICTLSNDNLEVGPESAGANPGPACYGNGGPLTITDINLLAGRLVANSLPIPVDIFSSEEVIRQIITQLDETTDSDEIVMSLLKIANEKMASAINKLATKKGVELKELALTTFGGAGGQHACDIAEILGINQIIIPYDAGILSAYGIGMADFDKIYSKLLLRPLKHQSFHEDWQELLFRAFNDFKIADFEKDQVKIKHKYYYVRFKGQDVSLEIDGVTCDDIVEAFKKAYQNQFGHWIENRDIEVESIKLVSAIFSNTEVLKKNGLMDNYHPEKINSQESLVNGKRIETPIYKWEKLRSRAEISGPAILISDNCTVYIKTGWDLRLNESNTALLRMVKDQLDDRSIALNEANRTLFQNRFENIVEQMGATLERTSFSVNIKERLDFSCALLDNQGSLIVNAPHIPVHLGSLGLCVRKVTEKLKIDEGDIIITNHPGFGGSHLPDVTLISGVFYQGQLIGYVANRAHHSEIGGKTPGSMPVDATKLEEEGVLIPPMYLLKKGKSRMGEVEKVFTSAKYPSRSLDENMADILASISSINSGIQGLKSLCKAHGSENVLRNMSSIKNHANSILLQKLGSMSPGLFCASEKLDDGSLLEVSIEVKSDHLSFDFSGSSQIHPNNLNATDAIVQSVVLYVLRLLVGEDIPLNEGLLLSVSIHLPEGMLNPDFSQPYPPAIVGGNTEVSQRLTDTILKALELSACSQGTMNNLLFGDDKFGYYETIGGGTGAGINFHGHDAIHQHMTNTKITDPEILELRYPVTLRRFSVRANSGGKGFYNGGDGIIREFCFKRKLTVTLLTQHRKIAPYGLKGGEEAKKGVQYITKKDGLKLALNSCDQVQVNHGDILTIETPGGGGYGSADE